MQTQQIDTNAQAQAVEAKAVETVEHVEQQVRAEQPKQKAKAKQAKAQVTHQPVSEVKFSSKIDELRHLLTTVKPRKVEEFKAQLVEAFNTRKAHELKKKPDNAGIQKKLDKYLSTLTQGDTFARLCVAFNISPNFINAQKRSGDSFNVYAVDKIIKCVAALFHEAHENAANAYILRALFRFEAKKKQFRQLDAELSIRRQLNLPDNYEYRDLMPDHLRYSGITSAASTQASSTCAALCVLGVMRSSAEGESMMNTRNVRYVVNSDALITEALREMTKKRALTNVVNNSEGA